MDHDLELALAELHPMSWRWALGLCGGRRSEAEDVLQTAYLKVIDGRARFAGQSSLKTWLFAVIRRTAAERRRTAWLRDLLLLRWRTPEPAPPTPIEEVDRAGQRARVRAALGRLPRRQREVIELVFFHDLSIAQAGEVMAVTLGSARQHYERGKQRLAVLLAEGA